MRATSFTVFTDPLYNVNYCILRSGFKALPALAVKRLPTGIATALTKENLGDDLGGWFGLYRSSEPEIYGVLYVNSDCLPADQRLIITHECLHATLQVMRLIGCRPSAESEEAFTYYHTWLTGEVWKRLGLLKK